jgi:hypothetical protein
MRNAASTPDQTLRCGDVRTSRGWTGIQRLPVRFKAPSFECGSSPPRRPEPLWLPLPIAGVIARAHARRRTLGRHPTSFFVSVPLGHPKLCMELSRAPNSRPAIERNAVRSRGTCTWISQNVEALFQPARSATHPSLHGNERRRRYTRGMFIFDWSCEERRPSPAGRTTRAPVRRGCRVGRSLAVVQTWSNKSRASLAACFARSCSPGMRCRDSLVRSGENESRRAGAIVWTWRQRTRFDWPNRTPDRTGVLLID